MLAQDFIDNCKALVGQSYELTDCIGVVRKALGIQCQGTNWLWRSVNNSSKYKYLTYRSTTFPGAVTPGTVLFKINFGDIPPGYSDKPNCYHIGVPVGDGMVVDSTPKYGVRLRPLYPEEWDAWGMMKQVEFPAFDIPEDDDEDDTPVRAAADDLLREIYRLISDYLED